MRNRPVVSTAKVRGLIKKSGISYVDATRRYYPSIAQGVHVWQLSSSVLFQVYSYESEEKRGEILQKFVIALASQGLSAKERSGSFEIVKE